MTKIEVLDTFKGGSMATTFLIKKGDKTLVRKVVSTKTDLGSSKLMKQFDWLKKLRHNESIVNVERMFNIGQCPITKVESAWYDMEVVEGKDLIDYLLELEKFDKKVIEDFVRVGSEIAEKVSYTSEEPDKDYVTKQHLLKIISRNSADPMHALFNSDTPITINGKKYQKHGMEQIEELLYNEEFKKFFAPNCVHNSHGDYTLQNAIIGSNGKLTIIDPRGEGPDTIFYDISKIYQSLHGKYDLISRGDYCVDISTFNCIYYEFDWDREQKLDEYFNYVKKLIPQYYNFKTGNKEVDEHLEKNWDLITRFYEASHFLSMTPFRIKESLESAIICYAIGTEILNKVVEDYKNVQKESKLVANS